MDQNAGLGDAYKSPEQVLLDYVDRLERHREDRRAVHLHLSRLRAQNRRQQERLSAMRRVVALFKLVQSQQSSKLSERLAHAGLRSRDMVTVFLFFKVVTPLLLGAAVFVLVYVLDIGALSSAGQWCAILVGAAIGAQRT